MNQQKKSFYEIFLWKFFYDGRNKEIKITKFQKNNKVLEETSKILNHINKK